MQTLSPITPYTNIASLEMWETKFSFSPSVSKNLMSILKSAPSYFDRKRLVCRSPICIQNATPESKNATAKNSSNIEGESSQLTPKGVKCTHPRS